MWIWKLESQERRVIIISLGSKKESHSYSIPHRKKKINTGKNKLRISEVKRRSTRKNWPRLITDYYLQNKATEE